MHEVGGQVLECPLVRVSLRLYRHADRLYSDLVPHHFELDIRDFVAATCLVHTELVLTDRDIDVDEVGWLAHQAAVDRDSSALDMTAHIAPHNFVSQEGGVVADAHYASPSCKHVPIQSHLKTQKAEVVCPIEDAIGFRSWRSLYENSIEA